MATPFDVPLEESVQILKRVLPLMSKQRIPTIPQNYAVWYDYVTHRNDHLQQDVERLIQDGQAFSPEQCRSIYEKYFLAELSAEVDGIQGAVRNTVESVLSQLGSLGSDISHFSNVLEECGISLTGELSQEDLGNLVVRLAQETQTTKQRSTEVEGSLQSMAEEMSELRAQINRLSRDSRTDSLTGVANRRALDEAFPKLISESESQGHSLCLIMADIDRFKVFNDTHGHLMGDRVLRTVAQEMQQCVKGRDLISRFGGEEFALLLPATPLDGAMMLAESIRAIIESLSVPFVINNAGDAECAPQTGAQISVTVSLGVAVHRPGESVSDFLERADLCLYRSKDNGRNRVTGEHQI